MNYNSTSNGDLPRFTAECAGVPIFAA